MAALDGIRVLDLSRVVSGPFCSMLLGDLGAEVIKLEEPEHGDDSRAFGPPFSGGESAYFLSVNRNKRSIAVDLRTSEGIAVARRLPGPGLGEHTAAVLRDAGYTDAQIADLTDAGAIGVLAEGATGSFLT